MPVETHNLADTYIYEVIVISLVICPYCQVIKLLSLHSLSIDHQQSPNMPSNTAAPSTSILQPQTLAILQARGEGDLNQGFRSISSRSYSPLGSPNYDQPTQVFIPDKLNSRETLRWLGFADLVVEMLVERFTLYPWKCFFDVVKHHILHFPGFDDAFAPEDNWIGYLAALGCCEDFADEASAC